MALFQAMGDLYLQKLKRPDAAVEVFKVVAMVCPTTRRCKRSSPSWRASSRATKTARPMRGGARCGDGEPGQGGVGARGAGSEAQRLRLGVARGAGRVGAHRRHRPNEREILTKLTSVREEERSRDAGAGPIACGIAPVSPARARADQRADGDPLRVRAHIYKEEFTSTQIDKRRHFIDVKHGAGVQIHHFRYVSRILGMEGVTLYSPYLAVTRERMAKKTTEPAPEPSMGVEICHTEPACLKVGGKFFSETGQKEVYYMLGRSLALMRPEPRCRSA